LNYREYVQLTREQVEPYIGYSKSFVKKIEDFLEENKLFTQSKIIRNYPNPPPNFLTPWKRR
jgi:hypothetical protein